MTKSFQNSQVANIIPSFTGFKNKIINGNLNIWQRGENDTISEANDNLSKIVYVADRVRTEIIGHISGNLQIEKGTNSITGNNSIKFTSVVDSNGNALDTDDTISDTTPTGGYFYAYTPEGSHLYSEIYNGEYVTISFWFKGNVAGTYNVTLRQCSGGTDSSGNELGYSYVTDFEYDGKEEWVKIVKTIKFDNTILQEYNKNDVNAGMCLYIAAYLPSHMCNTTDKWVNSTDNINNTKYRPICDKNATKWYTTANAYVEISNVQLERGTEATDFEQIPYDIQLYRCMWYYEKINCSRISASWVDGTQVFAQIKYSVPKRAKPVILDYEFIYWNGSKITCGINSIGGDEYSTYVNIKEPADRDYGASFPMYDGSYLIVSADM